MASEHKAATLYFDLISPFSYFFFKEIEREPLPVALSLQPVVFAALLKAHDNKGPAEIGVKREFTYRYCLWYAAHRGHQFAMPGAHPFNPIRHLRAAQLLIGDPPRVQRLFDAVWTSGDDPQDERAWTRVCARIGIEPDDPRLGAESTKAALRAGTDAAIAAGVFGVPTVIIDGRPFWGVDALPMLRDYLAGHPVFASTAMQAAGKLPVGVARR
jgi:2-hydroxychromene-2-carboxylate isomerase